MTPSNHCLFCRIANREIPAEFVYEDEQVIAFRDINPQAPHHYLVIPRTHVANLNEIDQESRAGVATLLEIGGQIAKEQGLHLDGYRCVINNGKNAGQEVAHLHLHILGGRSFRWPPG